MPYSTSCGGGYRHCLPSYVGIKGFTGREISLILPKKDDLKKGSLVLRWRRAAGASVEPALRFRSDARAFRAGSAAWPAARLHDVCEAGPTSSGRHLVPRAGAGGEAELD